MVAHAIEGKGHNQTLCDPGYLEQTEQLVKENKGRKGALPANNSHPVQQCRLHMHNSAHPSGHRKRSYPCDFDPVMRLSCLFHRFMLTCTYHNCDCMKIPALNEFHGDGGFRRPTS